jgi:transcriptional regulator with XRE-family HTH domain
MQKTINIAENIRKLRVKQNLSQDELAKKIGLTSRGAINNYEMNVNYPPLNKIVQLMQIFKVDFDTLVFSTDL